MLQSMKSRKVIGVKLTKEEPMVFSQIKYSGDDWDSNNKLNIDKSCNQIRLAQRLVGESKRIVDEVTEITKNWQREVDHQLRERSDEVNFLNDELKKQRKTAALEEEALNHYRNRILKALEYLEKTLKMNQDCMKLRSARFGIDLCTDIVEKELIQELKTTKGCKDTLESMLKQTTEQLQRLRAAIYLVDIDLGQKHTALSIDDHNLNLKEHRSDLRRNLDFQEYLCKYTLAQWQEITAKNIQSNAKELYSAAELRGYIDLILKQVFEDLRNQTDRTNDAFRRRIRETREIKHILEEKHAQIMIEIVNTDNNIHQLQQELDGRERSLVLCQTRLTNRSHRPELELTCDIAQEALLSELNRLRCTISKLKQKLAENKAMMRYLSHTHFVQEEEINMKGNTLKIDEVDCQVLREILKYTPF